MSEVKPSSVPTAAVSGTTVPNSRLSNRPWLVRLEYLMYVIGGGGVYYLAFTELYKVSQEPQTLAKSRPSLSPAWIWPDVFGGVDLSDHQLHSFLSNLHVLILGLAAYIGISRSVRSAVPAMLPLCHLVLNTAFLVYLHGVTVGFMLAIYLVNFLWSKMSRRVPFAVYYGVGWAFHLAVLFANDMHKGYSFAAMSPSLAWLDSLGGGLIRWHVIFNMSTLRMIGYLYDVWEANNKGDAVRVENEAKHNETCADCAEFRVPCYRLRAASPRPREENGSLIAYLAYLTYVPLYIGGPVANFNAYMSQLRIPQRAFDTKRCVIYGLRTFGIYLTLIAMLHINHLSALRRDDQAFDRMSIAVKGLYGVQFLAFLWLKFNMIWKFFRLVGLLDGVEAPEDMNRCFANTTTVSDFWRDWHSSFNLWIVRYMYIPLGGNRAKAFTVVPIFIFIAVWHDIELHLLWWAGIMVVAFIPELVVGAWFARKCKWMRDRPYYRHVRALGCTASTFSLVVANLFGYGTGMASGKGVEGLSSSVNAVIGMFVLFFSANNIGLQHRAVTAEDEARRRLKFGLVKSR